jgi:hypothetical protein
MRTISEVNAINKVTGQPLIKAEIKYIKASPEPQLVERV